MKFKPFFFLFLFAVLLSIAPLTANAQARIPDCLLSYKFGPEQHIIIVEKSTQTLSVYSNYQPEPVETFTITTGKKNGRKLREGDLKTPEGIYYFRRILSGDQLPKVDDYGEKAFTLNYPNPVDKKEARAGSGIWLHGAFSEDKTSNPNNTRGCVVMKNGDLTKVSKYIFLNQTPICIYDKITYDTEENIRTKRDRFIEHLREWKTNWENKNIEGYIDYYEKIFSYSGMNRARFKTYKKNLNSTYRFIKVTLSDINVYHYQDYYIVMFHQLYISDRNHFYSKKIQYWRDAKDADKARIAAEYNVSLPPIDKFEVSRGNYVTIDQFRKDYLRQLESSTVNMAPPSVTLDNISIFEETVTLSIRRDGRNNRLKVIPVLRLQNPDGSPYRSLDGVSLDGGVPGDYSTGIRLENRETKIVMKKEKNVRLRSLTLFLVNSFGKLEQIVTYFVDK
ncbi:MAG: L,D-transpeptidase family protein [bacterium]|nr:L,D-transpeptidase family protein [bacterium]